MVAQGALKTVKELRDDLKLTLEQLAARTGHRVTAGTISRIERGESVPERRTREDIAQALGVPVDAINWPERLP
jgi:transcriptional regulator with XRE-family HTH domain